MLIYSTSLKDMLEILEIGYLKPKKELFFVKNEQLQHSEGATIWLDIDCISNKSFKFNGKIIKCDDAEKILTVKLDPDSLNKVSTGKLSNKYIRRIHIMSNDKKRIKKVIDLAAGIMLSFCGFKPSNY